MRSDASAKKKKLILDHLVYAQCVLTMKGRTALLSEFIAFIEKKRLFDGALSRWLTPGL